jgi:tRNA dimethylallyltransferase
MIFWMGVFNMLKVLMTKNQNKTLIVLTGPTAVGKTELSLRLAKCLHTEIVSADARQFYRELTIGTAAPSPHELSAIKHHFIGHLSVFDYYNVSLYEQHALEVINNLFEKSDYVVLAGGSGLYIDTLCCGIDTLPPVDHLVREKVQGVFESDGLAGIRNWLRRVDPAYYHIVDPANPKRIMRGLEVFLQTGIPYSEHRKHKTVERPFNIKRVVLHRQRDELFTRINDRVLKMIHDGLVEECLLMFKYRHLNALNTVGYKELFAWISNEWPLSHAIERIQTNTRRFAKRQITWFKRYHDAGRFHPDDVDGILQYVKKV